MPSVKTILKTSVIALVAVAVAKKLPIVQDYV